MSEIEIRVDVGWMRYLRLDQALVFLLGEFDLEKHLTLDQVCFFSLKKVLFIISILSCYLTCKGKQQGKVNLKL